MSKKSGQIQEVIKRKNSEGFKKNELDVWRGGEKVKFAVTLIFLA